eukprot:812628_1
MKRVRKIVNYAEEASPEPLAKSISVSIPTWFGIQFDAGKVFPIRNMYEFFIHTITAFEVDKKQPNIICDIITKRGIVKKSIIPKETVPFEWWISSIVGIETKLVLIGWLTESEIAKYRLSKHYQPKFSKGDKVFHLPIVYCQCQTQQCKCPQLGPIKAKILAVDAHQYCGELDCEFKIQIWDRRFRGG